MTLDHVCNFLLKNLSSPVHSLRTLSMHMMRNLTPYFVADDIEMYDIKSEQIDKDEHQEIKWHFLNRFEDYIGRYDGPIRKYLQEFRYGGGGASYIIFWKHSLFSFFVLFQFQTYRNI